MTTRALYRIFGLFLVTWSIIEQPVYGVPVAVAIPRADIMAINETKNQTRAETLATAAVSVTNVNKTSSKIPDRSKSTNIPKLDPIKTAPVTALPTSEYVELTSIDNITNLLRNDTRKEAAKETLIENNTTAAKENTKQKDIRNQEEPNKKVEIPTQNSTSVLLNSTKSSTDILTETSHVSNETKKARPEIVSVLDNIGNYDSLLSNFMNTSGALNASTEQPVKDKSPTTNTTLETKSTNITNTSGRKYNEINRKRTTKSNMAKSPELVTKEAEPTSTENNEIKNVSTHAQSETDGKPKDEILKGIASTWNRTTFSNKVLNTTEPNKVNKKVTTTTSSTTDGYQATIDTAESGILASKRSGYLDNSKMAVEMFTTTTLPEIPTAYLEAEEIDNINMKPNVTVVSKQQMAEDALNEARLKESSLMNDAESKNNEKVNEESQFPGDVVTTTDSNNSNLRQNSSLKNPSLYRVNSNYKPLKKLEVLPHKSFMIDPDDNTWRNESINSRGIVYKPKNSSKPFTQVLKNKTESEWHNLLEKEFKDEEIELKERLEKIAAVRKSKKKLTTEEPATTDFTTEMQFVGDKTQSTSLYIPIFNQVLFTTSLPVEEVSSTTLGPEKLQHDNSLLTEKPMEHLNNADAYDAYDEDDRFMTVTEFDLLKTTKSTTKIRTPSYPQKAFVKPEKSTTFPHYTTHYPPDRKGTIEYFPPKTTKVNFNDYDLRFKEKVNTFTTDFLKNRIEPLNRILTTAPPPPPRAAVEPPVYMMPPYETHVGTAEDDSYVIRHFKDMVSKAAGEQPPRPPVVHRFIESFNRNADKLKEEFPILYNTNIVHSGDDGRIVASSSAYLRRLQPAPRPLDRARAYDAACNHSVELSPAYELHYFVNDEEQKQAPNLDQVAAYDFGF